MPAGGGGLLQLVAYGAQDVYLTANPQVTFFKQLYRRHSNFSMESIEQTFNGVASFGRKVTCTIARNGDLVSKVYLQATLPRIDKSDISGEMSWVPYVGQFLIKNVEIEIGGQLIDKHYGDWLHIWNELTLPAGKTRNYLRMVNGYGGQVLAKGQGGACDDCAADADADPICDAFGSQQYTNLLVNGSNSLCSNCDLGRNITGNCLPETTLYVPLEFWFNRHYGLALPLIALQYHEVKINVEFNEARYLVNTNVQANVNEVNRKGLVAASLWVDYIYLDTEERRRFAQVAHEYLIEQLQFTGEESVTSSANRLKLDFNHPVKELVWVVQNPAYLDCNSECNQPWRYSDASLKNPTAVAKLQLNGHDRFAEREGDYFNFVQPYQHHTASPSTGINVYSFAIRPEEHQPSGSCNFSRIDNAVLNLTLTRDTFETIQDGGAATEQNSALVRVYAVNYNVLRIMSGMGGLAYSN
jgi:Large eukaryotic DNA virus major capsid protein/Major capsid protein N-terminus